MCSNSHCPKKIIYGDMSFQKCPFLLLQCYFLSVGVAKRDVIRGIDADKSIPL